MCGIAGFLGFRYSDQQEYHNTVKKMGDAINHRGPDDFGTWCDADVQVAIVHRRLSILDLSPAGHQPMASRSGRYIIAFNGEIYNHKELRKQLNSGPWRGHSDTETLLAGIDEWGLEKTLQQSVGMFALALWDKQERVLTLARDRMGEKPLYYGWQRGVFMFGSELKSLKAHPAFVGQISRDAIALQMRHNYIPAPHTIYKDIFKLLPGNLARAFRSNDQIVVESATYWSFKDSIDKSRKNMFVGTDVDAVNELDSLLTSCIKQQMVADVPLGAFLSGGIDSSTIVSIMQAQSPIPVKTFTIGFNETGYNEAVHAKTVATHLGTDHTELYVSPQEAVNVIPRLPALYDEPFSDSSQIPTFLVSEMTRQHVTVSISGDAGDELFGGYGRYLIASSIWSKIAKAPLWLRRAVAATLTQLNVSQWDKLFGVLPRSYSQRSIGNKIHSGSELIKSTSESELYLKMLSHWTDPCALVLGSTDVLTQITNPQFAMDEMIEQMMALDSVSYLPDDILCKVDRAAMAASLETRVPMLDHRIVEFAWSLPFHMKVRDGRGKWILREVLGKYVPLELVDRPKMGFGVPIDSWLRGPLRDWAEELLNETRLMREGIFDPIPIRQKWDDHLSGRRNWQHQLWDVLMFQAWLEAQSA